MYGRSNGELIEACWVSVGKKFTHNLHNNHKSLYYVSISTQYEFEVSLWAIGKYHTVNLWATFDAVCEI